MIIFRFLVKKFNFVIVKIKNKMMNIYYSYKINKKRKEIKEVDNYVYD